jgi:hypothetical protein
VSLELPVDTLHQVEPQKDSEKEKMFQKSEEKKFKNRNKFKEN